MEREYSMIRSKFTVMKLKRIIGNDCFRPYDFRVVTSNALFD